MSEDDVIPLREYVEAMLREKDLRDQQRYDAQIKALEAALLAQKDAVTTAMISSEKAVIKAETAAERRFECVSADTPILCTDLIWRPAGDLIIGDEIIGFDEESPNRSGRRFRKAFVTDNSLATDNLLKVNTPLGSVTCNYNHLWLAKPGYRTHWRWVRADELEPGWAVMHSVDVWEVDQSWDSGWLAGMFDGEGCLCFDKNGSVQLSVTQRESATSDRLNNELRTRLDTFVTHRQEKNKPGSEQRKVGGFTPDRKVPGTSSTPNNTVPFYHFIISARSSVMKIIGSVRPPRLLVNSDRIWEDKPIGGVHRDTVVTSVEPAGTGTIARLSTSSRTYFAGGFAMHNSVNEFRAQLADQATTFMPRAEAEQRMSSLSEKIDNTFSVMNEKIDSLKETTSQNTGKSAGTSSTVGYFFVAGGLILTVLTIVVTVVVALV